MKCLAGGFNVGVQSTSSSFTSGAGFPKKSHEKYTKTSILKDE